MYSQTNLLPTIKSALTMFVTDVNPDYNSAAQYFPPTTSESIVKQASEWKLLHKTVFNQFIQSLDSPGDMM